MGARGRCRTSGCRLTATGRSCTNSNARFVLAPRTVCSSHGTFWPAWQPWCCAHGLVSSACQRRETAGILPFALRVSLRLLKIAPGDFVAPNARHRALLVAKACVRSPSASDEPKAHASRAAMTWMHRLLFGLCFTLLFLLIFMWRLGRMCPHLCPHLHFATVALGTFLSPSRNCCFHSTLICLRGNNLTPIFADKLPARWRSRRLVHHLPSIGIHTPGPRA